jgi:hypothetical protein
MALLNRNIKLGFNIATDVTLLGLYTGFMFFTKCIQVYKYNS